MQMTSGLNFPCILLSVIYFYPSQTKSTELSACAPLNFYLDVLNQNLLTLLKIKIKPILKFAFLCSSSV